MPRPFLTVAAALVLALFIADTLWLHSMQPLENRLSDFFVRRHAQPLQPDPDIVILDIDESSLARMQPIAGNWPWPRAVHAELVQGLSLQKPKAIVFDLLFSERDVYRPDSDQALNAALNGLSNVYFPLVRLDPGNDAQAVPLTAIAPWLGIQPGPHADQNARVALLLPQALDPKHWRSGAINFIEDRDGIGRRYQVRIPAYGWEIPSLPARLAAELGYPLPVQDDIILHWRGGADAFRHISYADLFEDFSRQQPKRDPREFRDKIVIIGTTATGLHDIRATPVASMYPAVSILATAIDNLKNQRHLQSAPIYYSLFIAIALILAQLAALRRAVNALAVGLLLVPASAALLAASYWLLGRLVLFPVLSALVFSWSFYFIAALGEYLREKKVREQAVRLFGRFLDPRVVKDLVAHGETPQSLSGQSCDVTILFSDIRGFTSLAESKPPQEVVALLNRYFSLQVEVIFRHGGTLDKFIGDAIMAFWGAPTADQQHAARAVAAALEMQSCLLQFRQELGAAGENFDVGIGIHSGPAVVGFIGSQHRLEYTAIGDTVNLASRIEGLTKGVARILVSRDTLTRCGDAFDFIPHGSYKVKGRAQEVELFEPRPPTGSA